MTTSHDLAAMTDEQFEHHLLVQAARTQTADMRSDADHLEKCGDTIAAMLLRNHARRLERSLSHTDGI